MKELHEGHGDHWATIYQTAEDVVLQLPNIIQDAKLLGITDDIEVIGYTDTPEYYKIAYLTYPLNEQLNYCILILLDHKNNKNAFFSAYPITNSGMHIQLELVEIQEWSNQVEAVLTAVDQEGYEYRFFDNLYALNKHQYKIGESYYFVLGATASQVEILEKPSFQFEGEQAIDFLTKLGEEIEDPDNVGEVTFDLSQLKAFFQTEDSIPQLAEFQSPIEDIHLLKVDNHVLYQFDIQTYENDLPQYLPLFVKKELLNKEPEIKQPLRGILYLFGYLSPVNQEFSQ